MIEETDIPSRGTGEAGRIVHFAGETVVAGKNLDLLNLRERGFSPSAWRLASGCQGEREREATRLSCPKFTL